MYSFMRYRLEVWVSVGFVCHYGCMSRNARRKENALPELKHNSLLGFANKVEFLIDLAPTCKFNKMQ